MEENTVWSLSYSKDGEEPRRIELVHITSNGSILIDGKEVSPAMAEKHLRANVTATKREELEIIIAKMHEHATIN